MKKLSLTALLCAFVILISGCSQASVEKDANAGTAPENPASSAPNTTPAPEKGKNTGPRTVDISAGIASDGYSYSYAYDFDFDGTNEQVSIQTVQNGADSWDSNILVSVGNYSKPMEIIDGSIEKVYACDVDTEDGVLDLAIITCEVSGDPRIRIVKYDAALSPRNFVTEDFDGAETIEDSNWLGYATSYYFYVNDDDTITLEEQTNSAGMWSVYRTYYQDGGVYRERKQETYNVLPDFMDQALEYGQVEFAPDELEMWKKGYIKARVAYAGSDINLQAGDYFKVLYDDDKNNLFIEKESGESGWINVNYDNEARYELNEMYFYLAG